MTGLGTIINSAAILAGGIVGHFAGRLFKEEQQDSLTKACGVSVLFIAVAGAMQGMLSSPVPLRAGDTAGYLPPSLRSAQR